MGYQINVNRSKLTSAAQEIRTNAAAITTELRKISTAVEKINSNWSGEEYDAFLTQWNAVLETNSTNMKMVAAMYQYADQLEAIEEQYKKAQANAITASNNLSV